MRSGGSSARSALVHVALAALAFRIGSALIGFLVNALFPGAQREQFVVFGRTHLFWDAFARWDSGWYGGVARDGYRFVEAGRSNLAFFPAYPMAMRYLDGCSAARSPTTTVGVALTSFGPRAVSRAIALALAAATVALQPGRLAQAATIHRMPEYGPLVRASRAIAARRQPMRRIDAPFLPPGSDPYFLYEILGGRVSPQASWIAVVDADGQVRFQRVPASASR